MDLAGRCSTLRYTSEVKSHNTWKVQRKVRLLRCQYYYNITLAVLQKFNNYSSTHCTCMYAMYRSVAALFTNLTSSQRGASSLAPLRQPTSGAGKYCTCNYNLCRADFLANFNSTNQIATFLVRVLFTIYCKFRYLVLLSNF